MGTNYYLHQKPDCECCGRPFEPLHIGKSSAGWCFALHALPERGIHDLEDWWKLWCADGAIIKNEYGERITADVMLEIVTKRSRDKRWDDLRWPYMGYPTEEEFHYLNQSQRGPNELLRAKLGGRCVKHGDGTWDCIIGEFS